MMLDRTRSFGMVYGGGAHAYEQDGKVFDHDGVEITSEEPPVDAPRKPGRPAKTKVDDQLSAQLEG